jgi:hypothetical protein
MDLSRDRLIPEPELRKPTEIFTQNSQCPGRDSNGKLPEYSLILLPLGKSSLTRLHAVGWIIALIDALYHSSLLCEVFLCLHQRNPADLFWNSRKEAKSFYPFLKVLKLLFFSFFTVRKDLALRLPCRSSAFYSLVSLKLPSILIPSSQASSRRFHFLGLYHSFWDVRASCISVSWFFILQSPYKQDLKSLRRSLILSGIKFFFNNTIIPLASWKKEKNVH